MPSAARHSPFWPSVVLLVLASLVYCAPLFVHLDWYGWQDWDQFTFRYETSRVALLRDMQWPVWNPYGGGGTALLAHPHSPVLSPWYAITLLLGAPLGLRVQVVVFMALGSVGMAAVMRRLGAGRAAGICAGIVFMMSAHFALHITEGHLEWSALGVMPWVALGLLSTLSPSQGGVNRAPLLRSALLFGSVLTFGAIYISAVYLLFFTAWMTFESLRHRRVTPLAAWALVAALAAGVAGAKLVPMVNFVSDYPRQTTSMQRTTIKALAISLRSIDQPARYAEYQNTKRVEFDASMMPWNFHRFDFEFHEYGAYLGIVGMIAALAGFVATARAWWPLYAAGGVMAWIMLGSTVTPDLWALIRRLPMYEQMQVPSRMLASLVFVAAVAAGFGMDLLRTRRVIPWILCALLYLELVVMGHTLFRQIFRVPPITLTTYSAFAQRPAPAEAASLVPGTMKSLMYPRLVANWGAVDGYENLNVVTGRVRTTADPDYRGELHVDGADGVVTPTSWTMARVRAHVRAAGPVTVVMNQNFERGWRVRLQDATGAVTTTPAIRTSDGLVGALAPSGDSDLEFVYWPAGLTEGAWLSVGALLVCVAGLRRW